VERFKRRWNGDLPDAMAALGHDAVLVLADGIRRAGGTEGAKLRDALAATRDVSGATGKTTLDAQRNATKAAVVITVKQGRFTFVESVAP